MNKNMFKRAFLNIMRKKSKTIIMFIIMFVVANLVLASIAISNATKVSTEFAKETIGSEVYLKADMEKVKKEMTGGKFGGSKPKIERPEINLQMVLGLANSEYVKDYTYSTYINVIPSNYTKYEEDEISTNRKPNMIKNTDGVNAINSFAFIPEVESGIITISEGTYFDESTMDKVIISDELALINDFSVGDKIVFLDSKENEVSYEIIGLFSATESGYENNIYMNLDSAEKLMSDEQFNNDNYIVNNVIYYLNNPDKTDEFLSEAQEEYNFEDLGLTLDINNDAYEKMVGPIQSVGSFANIILIVMSISAVAILSLIINNNIKERKYEIGVLMSLGAHKKNIIGQMFIELFLVSTVGFILSFASSGIIANTLSTNLLNNQVEMSEEISEKNYNRPGNGMMKPGANPSKNELDSVEVIDDIDVNITFENCMILLLFGYSIILVSMIIPSLSIMKYEPKTILTGRE